MKYFSVLGVVSSRSTVPLFIRNKGGTEWLDEYENRVDHLLQPSQSADLNPAEHLWNILDLLDIGLHYHHQNIRLEEQCFILLSLIHPLPENT